MNSWNSGGNYKNRARIIFSADDFGYCSGVNKAVVEAYSHGLLTSAGIMVNGDAVEEAVELARENPGLAIGIHVVLTEGRPVLPPEKVSLLVDSSGNFLKDPVRLGLKIFFSGGAQIQLAAELQAQFEKFLSFNFPLNHIDGHIHFHLHPTVCNLLIPLAIRFGATGYRLVNENLPAVIKYSSQKKISRLLMSVIFRVLASGDAVRRAGLIVSDRTFGFCRSGEMSEDYVISILNTIKSGVVEFYFHPAISSVHHPLGANPGDLQTLLSNRVRRAIYDHHFHTISYRDLRP